MEKQKVLQQLYFLAIFKAALNYIFTNLRKLTEFNCNSFFY